MARQAVDALRRMQDGFFIRKQLGTHQVELRLPGGTRMAVHPERATALYLKVLRDATHGHGGRGKTADQTAAALLADHDGDVPHDIGLLAAHLYLLDMIANPQRLRRCLYRSGQCRPRISSAAPRGATANRRSDDHRSVPDQHRRLQQLPDGWDPSPMVRSLVVAASINHG